MDTLVAFLISFIIANSQYEMPEEPLPAIEILETSMCEHLGMQEHCPFGGRYYPKKKHKFGNIEGPRIVLENTYKEGDPNSEALLLHELVHWVQDMTLPGGLVYGDPQLVCRAEYEAYMIANRYLTKMYNRNYFRHAMLASRRACSMAWRNWRRNNPIPEDD